MTSKKERDTHRYDQLNFFKGCNDDLIEPQRRIICRATPFLRARLLEEGYVDSADKLQELSQALDDESKTAAQANTASKWLAVSRGSKPNMQLAVDLLEVVKRMPVYDYDDQTFMAVKEFIKAAEAYNHDMLWDFNDFESDLEKMPDITYEEAKARINLP